MGDKMKSYLETIANILITLGFFLIFIVILLLNQNTIISFIKEYLTPNTIDKSLGVVNEYYRDYEFMYVNNTKNYTPNNYQELLDLIYTGLNAGKESFYFYCHDDYKDCLEDVKKISKDQTTLSDINNFVHPYNSFSHVGTSFNNLGKVTFSFIRNYSEEEILKINSKVDQIFNELYNEHLSTRDNIKRFHDYIINNSRYDSDRSDKGIINYQSDKAYGPLFEGYAICGGYTDLMQLFLEKMHVKNYRVSSNDHIWNAVNISDKWYHIDLTWDDPVSSDGLDYLEHSYFLVSTNNLLKLGDRQHSFNQDVYKELKEAN